MNQAVVWIPLVTGHPFSGRHACAWDQVLGTDWPRERLDALSRLTTRAP